MKYLWALVILMVCQPVLATALVVSASSGTSLDVRYDYTGDGGNGFAMGTFFIENPHTATLVLNDITTTALQDGDDSTGLSEIGLFIDSDGNGTYDFALDTRYGSAYTAYPVDNGNLTFTASISFAPSEVRQFFIVGKLNGVVPPGYADTFHTIISWIGATGGPPSGVPTTFIRGANVIGASTPLALEYSVTGTAPPYDYAFRLVLDNHDGSWTSGMEWGDVRFGQAVYGSGGTAPFASWITNAASFPVGPFTHTLWANASVGGVSYSSPGLYDGTFPANDWIPSGVGDQLVWWGTCNVLLDDGEMSWSMSRGTGGPSIPGSANVEPAKRVGNWLRVAAVAGSAVNVGPTETGGGDGYAIGAFDVTAHDNASTLNSVTIAASGSGDDFNALSEIGLFVDANSNGVYDPGADIRYGPVYTSYTTDDGSMTFTDTLNFNASETKRLLIVAKLDGPVLATSGQTFNTTITAISATGGPHTGLFTAVIPGINIVAPQLDVTRGVAAIPNGGNEALGIVPAGVAQSLTYTITNNGTTTLDLTGMPVVALTPGANVSGLSITTAPATTIAPAGSTTFTLTFTATGASDFTVSIESNDPGNDPYTWTVTGSTPGSGGGSGSGAGDSGSCSSTQASSALWAFALIAALLAGLRLMRTRRLTR